ncbi:MAG: tRNA pseudouridine(38-40) synthase TruA [Phycisphaerae bacterium]|nr:tRNA pseudouridine(38-40) synthase TruA [Phycisphaerae bacterium]MDD5380017.1 tRNA pseudouridine(38-40) synthase TruA [Phycisphaerae bacterium]
MAPRNIKLTLSYDGLNYSGWQNQPGKNTIQGLLQQSLGDLTGTFIKINGCSRTDAGVSALGQVANFLIDSPIPTGNFVNALNHRLPRDIVVTEAVEVDKDFDASGSAKCKLYRYTIFTGKNRNVLKTRNCWHRPNPLDIAAMDAAAKMLLGTKDFKSFASAADKRDNSVRTVMRCEVAQEDKWVYIDIEADRFLYNMVRNIVGTLVEVGRGKWKPEKITEILDAKDRKAAGPLAPASGLCLMWIKY